MPFCPPRLLPILAIALIPTFLHATSGPDKTGPDKTGPVSTSSTEPPAPETPAASPATFPADSAASIDPASSLSLTAPLNSDASLPDAPDARAQTSAPAPQPAASTPPKQTKRILFIIPNFRSVTADEKLPPTTTHQKFKLMAEDTVDYSAFIEVAILSGMGEIQTSEPEFHGGFAGYGRYYWHSYADLADGNLMTEFLVPVATHEDPRYYTLGHGGFPKRTVYAISRLLITRNNQGNPTPNLSEIVGNGASAAISGLYYPRAERGWTKTGQRWVLQVGIDGLSNFVKEFWPEVNRDMFHSKY
jgi:hypothetical protein